MADTLVVLEQGSVSAMGPPDEVLRDERIRKVVIPDFSGIRDTKTERGIKNDAPEVVGVRHLSYAYGETLALDNVSLVIRAGEFVAIVGENGSGKTTLVKHFNRLLSPTSGDVIIRGKNTRSATITDLAHDVGLVFQNPDHMFFADTVKEEIGFGLKNLNIPDGDRIIDAALQEVGLLHTKDLYPRWLSRGERQRLAIACVIAMAPSIIVLDEPTTGLDGNEARLVMEILKGLQHEGHTIIVITHNREIAQNCADRIITMENGSIISDIFVRDEYHG
jgi:energy-coupling factor transporter ATP-binding protein EcfA2